MRIAYIAFVRLPTEKAHGAQIMKTCEALANEGAEVSLIVPGRRTRIAEDPFSFYGVNKVFDLTSLQAPDLLAFGPLGFALSALWFSQATRWTKEFRKADVIYSRDAFVLLQYLLLGRHLVYEAHTKPTLLSRFVARRVKQVVVISRGLREAYRTAGVPEVRITVAHDAIDPTPFEASFDAKAERARLGMPQEGRIALYVGKVDAGKGVPTLAAASAYTKTKIVIIGDGPLRTKLQTAYPEVLFLPETPYRDLPRVLASADVLVIPNSANEKDTALYTSPLKAFAYLAAKKPIVASDVPALREILNDMATFVPPDDPQSLAKALEGSITPRTVTKLRTWQQRAQAILKAL